MKAEEEDVDIVTIIDDSASRTSHKKDLIQIDAQDDEDVGWADEDPDLDGEPFKLKIVMQKDYLQ